MHVTQPVRESPLTSREMQQEGKKFHSANCIPLMILWIKPFSLVQTVQIKQVVYLNSFDWLENYTLEMLSISNI